MIKSTWAMLNEGEKALLRELDDLDTLDEDALLDLHGRVRKVRTKYATLHRRRASAQVVADGARGKAGAKHATTAAKAEAFEEALAVVSRHLTRAARASAAALKAERLTAARPPATGTAKAGSPRAPRASGAARAAAGSSRRTPASKRTQASTRAANRRAQAAHDGR